MNITTDITRSLKCTCKHEYQDKHYGKGMRLHNRIKMGTPANGWRCTVCGNVKKGMM